MQTVTWYPVPTKRPQSWPGTGAFLACFIVHGICLR